MAKKITKIWIPLVIAVLLVIGIYPLFWMLMASFKQGYEWTSKPAYALPDGIYFTNYIEAWTRGHMATFYKNSLICTLIALLFITIFSVTVGFALTKMEWKWKKAIDSYFRFGIMIPVAVALIPLFQIFNSSHLINTRTCLVLSYIAFGISLSVYLVTGYIKSLPDEILEAAVIDGCGIYRLVWYVVVPLMKNAIITVIVLQFFFKWNDLIFSMTFINSTELKTVQTGLMYFSDEFGSKNWGAIFASISISVFPMLLIYMFLNKAVIEGMTAGAVKG